MKSTTQIHSKSTIWNLNPTQIHNPEFKSIAKPQSGIQLQMKSTVEIHSKSAIQNSNPFQIHMKSTIYNLNSSQIHSPNIAIHCKTIPNSLSGIQIHNIFIYNISEYTLKNSTLIISNIYNSLAP